MDEALGTCRRIGRAGVTLLAALALLAPAVAPAAPLPDIDRPLKTGAAQPRDAAVVIGIEGYYELPDVPYAERDAQAFGDFLLYTRGIPSSRIARVPKANREKILEAVEAAGALAGSDGTVWVYFAGHGGASPDTGERVLMGIDVQPDLTTFLARSVRVAELRDAASAHGARVVMVFDTCYTGQGRSGTELLPGKRFAVPTYAGHPSGRVLEWSAASANQFSGPLEPARHGAFTYAVIGALRGWADGQLDDERDGRVTAEEARLYVEEALRSLQIRDQVPVLVADDLGAWVLADHPKTEAPPDLASAPAEPTVAAADPPPAAPPSPSPPPTVQQVRVSTRGRQVAPPRPSPSAGAVAPPSPPSAGGAARACFKRHKIRGGAPSTARIKVEVDGAFVAKVKNGQEACVALHSGARTVSVYEGMLPQQTRQELSVALAPGEQAWFLIGNTYNLQEFRQVSAEQYQIGAAR